MIAEARGNLFPGMLSQVGKYQILEKIGVGGFGAVYKGRDPFIKRNVAIKTCQSDEQEIRKRFFREAEYAGNLHHPNITTIYDFGVTEEGVPYIVQEFLTGEDLDRRIKRKDAIDPREKLRILSDICDGLGYAHAGGIVHRDIKPANIRILEDGTVKIMDFGIAKSMVSESTLTQTGITLGTASYLAPEQIRGEPVDQRTDIFSLGVLSYEFFTFQKPFSGDHISTVLYKILHEMPPPPSTVVPGLPPVLDSFIMSMLEKDRARRPANCTELRETSRRASASIDLTMGASGAPGGASEAPLAATAAPPGATPTGGYVTGRGSLPPSTTPSGSVADVSLHAGTGPSPRIPAPQDEGGGALKVLLGSLAVLVGGGALIWFAILGPLSRRQTAEVTAAAASRTPRTTAGPAASPVAGGPGPAPSTTAPPLPPPTATAPPAATPPPAAVKTGVAFFRPTLLAELTVDGKKRGSIAPAGLRISGLEPGRHKAFFNVPGYLSIEQPFVVRPGETVEVRADFPARGQLQISLKSPEWNGAEIFLDGKAIGKAPLTRTVASGTRRLEIRMPGFETFKQSVEVLSDDRTRVTVELRKN